MENGTEETLEIHDLAGFHKNRDLIPTYLQSSKCVIAVYDVTNINSFGTLERWIDLCKKCTKNKNLPILVVGCKCDLPKRVQDIDVLELCNKFNCEYRLCSAKEKMNIVHIFQKVIELSKSVQPKKFKFKLF